MKSRWGWLCLWLVLAAADDCKSGGGGGGGGGGGPPPDPTPGFVEVIGAPPAIVHVTFDRAGRVIVGTATGKIARRDGDTWTVRELRTKDTVKPFVGNDDALYAMVYTYGGSEFFKLADDASFAWTDLVRPKAINSTIGIDGMGRIYGQDVAEVGDSTSVARRDATSLSDGWTLLANSGIPDFTSETLVSPEGVVWRNAGGDLVQTIESTTTKVTSGDGTMVERGFSNLTTDASGAMYFTSCETYKPGSIYRVLPPATTWTRIASTPASYRGCHGLITLPDGALVTTVEDMDSKRAVFVRAPSATDFVKLFDGQHSDYYFRTADGHHFYGVQYMGGDRFVEGRF